MKISCTVLTEGLISDLYNK